MCVRRTDGYVFVVVIVITEGFGIAVVKISEVMRTVVAAFYHSVIAHENHFGGASCLFMTLWLAFIPAVCAPENGDKAVIIILTAVLVAFRFRGNAGGYSVRLVNIGVCPCGSCHTVVAGVVYAPCKHLIRVVCSDLEVVVIECCAACRSSKVRKTAAAFK